MTTIEERVNLLEKQQALQTEALRQILEGLWQGADGAAGTVVALMGGQQADFAPRPFPTGVRTRLMLDRALAPSLPQAQHLKDLHGVQVWGVYIGGPFYKSHGWTPTDVQQLSDIGMLFLPIYVGQQTGGTLTTAQGELDAADAMACMAAFGWQRGAPVCLDVEANTFDTNKAASVAYACAWMRRVRAGGLRPGLYAAPRTLVALAQSSPSGDEMPDFVWAASNFSDRLEADLTLEHIKGLPDALWSARGQRAWQYAISVPNQRVNLDGVEVDISLTSVAAGAPARD
jgi:Domain of unknown function (DUF1906)